MPSVVSDRVSKRFLETCTHSCVAPCITLCDRLEQGQSGTVLDKNLVQMLFASLQIGIVDALPVGVPQRGKSGVSMLGQCSNERRWTWSVLGPGMVRSRDIRCWGGCRCEDVWHCVGCSSKHGHATSANRG